MNDEEQFFDSVAFTQGQVLAHHFILLELFNVLANRTDDPQKFASTIYDKVCSRSDQMEKPDEKAAALYMRESVDRFFANLMRNL